MKQRLVVALLVSAFLLLAPAAFSQECTTCLAESKTTENVEESGCTSMVVGKLASTDGSVLASHTDCCTNSRVHVVPAQDYPAGSKAPVYWGLQNIPKGSTYADRGEIIGYIPQVSHTYAYFHTGYPQMNEYQLGIAETTISQKNEVRVTYGTCKQIMTIEQAQLFALQRCKTSRDALDTITGLLEKYGYLPSCCGKFDDGEALLIGDPNELWIHEVFSVGDGWDPASGEPGAVWAAQRVPDDHIKLECNHPTIGLIDPKNPDQKVSGNYMSLAVKLGLYDPKGGKPFVWHEVYAPPPTEGNMLRVYLFHSIFAPSQRHYRVWDPLDYYPFSVKPDKKVSVQDVIAFNRNTLEGTVWDMTADLDWKVEDGKGGFVKSPLTTPIPTKEMRELLDITWHRTISQGSYAMIAQMRSWLPDPIGGVYWFSVEQRAHSVYVPLYAGIARVNPLFSVFNPEVYQHDSLRWAIKFADSLLYLRYQDAIKTLREVRDPLEAGFFANQAQTDKTALELYRQSPDRAKQFLTDYSWNQVDEAMKAYTGLRYTLIQKYAVNTGGPAAVGGSYRGDDFVPAWPR